MFFAGGRKFVRARLAAAEQAKAKLKVEREKQRRKYPSGVIVNEDAIKRQPIASYQVTGSISAYSKNPLLDVLFSLESHFVHQDSYEKPHCCFLSSLKISYYHLNYL